MSIPLPNSIVRIDSPIVISASSAIRFQPETHELSRLANLLQNELQSRYGWLLEPTAATNSKPYISLILNSESKTISTEGYHLTINSQSVRIESSSPNGLFYGLQTLFQLLPESSDDSNSVTLNGCIIQDEPRFRWRGMHLDVSRHFFPVQYIKKFIDKLALHKLNVFHWHLTDDQGWRFESERYPKLTEIGAWRTEADGSRYGGFYSQQEMRDVVQYAAERYITVVPEIDVPGHTRALLAAYPEYSCTGKQQPVPNTWGIFDDVLCPANENVYEFLSNIFDEVCDIFPSQFIHIGGDECPTVRWKECPVCKEKMRLEGMHNERELQSYFTKRIAEMLSEKGRRAIGWDEILEGEIPSDAAVMSWRGIAGGVAAANAGHDVVMSPVTHCYFDYYQGPRESEPPAFPHDLLLGKVYEFEPLPAELSHAMQHHILGGQGNLWTEYMPSWEQVEYMAFPRLCALSEALWSKKKNYGDFLDRMKAHEQRLKRQGIHFRKIDKRDEKF